MPTTLTPRQIERLSALHDLWEESLLAVIELNVARQLLDGVTRRLSLPKRQPSEEQRRLLAEARRELAEQARHVDQSLVTEVSNWRFFAEQLQSALEEASLWRPHTRPSGSRPLYPSRTRTTTGTPST